MDAFAVEYIAVHDRPPIEVPHAKGCACWAAIARQIARGLFPLRLLGQLLARVLREDMQDRIHHGPYRLSASHAPRPPPLAPPTPPPVARLCSSASQLLWRGQTSHDRTSSATAPRLPDTDQCYKHVALADHEISRFPSKERPHMPVSKTTPGRLGARTIAPIRVAFRHRNDVGTQDDGTIAAQWLAYALPCQRFADALAGICA